ncbi:Centrosomal spindle body, CEP44-domain-containing protein [Powellomyces hirtus]|nr:Centrosomal spindle body, CEP44-domain-containing protein [Powellomyces hirtus]
MSATGDLNNNLLKTQADLRRIRYSGPFDVYGATKGDPTAFLPIIHFILLDFSHVLARHFASKGYELYGKKDARFIESTYRLLRDEFGYRPQLTKEQFFNIGFAERKLIFIGDLIRMAKTLHGNLTRHRPVEDGHRVTTVRNSPVNLPRHRTTETKRDPVRRVQAVRQSPPRSDRQTEHYYKILQNNVAIVNGHQSPEYDQAFRMSTRSLPRSNQAASHDGRNHDAPFANPDDSFHNQYHDVDEDVVDNRSPRQKQHSPDRKHHRTIPGNTDGHMHTSNATSWKSPVVAEEIVDAATSSSPARVQRHYSQHQYASGQHSSPPRTTQSASSSPAMTRKTEGYTIYEPAPHPVPAPLLVDHGMSMDLNFLEQPSILKSTPIPKSGLDDTFLSEQASLAGHGDAPTSPDVPKAGQQAKDDVEQASPRREQPRRPGHDQPNNHIAQSPARPDEQRHERNQQQPPPPLRPLQSSPVRPSTEPQCEGTQPFQFLSRTWVAPTAPPANAPAQTTVQPTASYLPYDMMQPLFDNFMSMFAAKEEEAMQLRKRVADLESRHEAHAEAMAARVAALEQRAAERSMLNGTIAASPDGRVPEPSLEKTPGSSLDGGAQTNGVQHAGPSQATHYASIRSNAPPMQDSFRTSQRYADDSGSPLHDAQQDGTMRSFRASVSTSQPSVFNTAYNRVSPTKPKSADDYIRSIQERMRHTSQFLKQRAKVAANRPASGSWADSDVHR